MNYAIAAGCDAKSEDEKAKLKELGLVGEHSYGVIGVAELTDADGNEVKLLKMRNPWGSFEWKGDWGDESAKWTPELKEQVGFTEAADDGTFYFCIDDLIKYFGRV